MYSSPYCFILICIIPLFSFVASDDITILKELYSTTAGSGWSNRTGWPPTSNCTTMFGIKCINSTTVTAIDLGYNNLTGNIPASIGNMTKLTSLILSGNSLSGNLPVSINGCVALTEIVIIGSHLRGSLPESLFSMRQLTILNLVNNSISGVVSPSLRNLTELVFLGLSGNSNLSGSILDSFSFIKNLTSVSVGGCLFSGAFPSTVGQGWLNLETLSLYNNFFYGSIPAWISQLSKLYTLRLNNNFINGTIPIGLMSLPSLSELNLSYNSLSGTIPNTTHVPEILYLNNNTLMGPIPFASAPIFGYNFNCLIYPKASSPPWWCKNNSCEICASFCGNAVVERNEDTETNGNCSSQCKFKNVGTPCRDATSECDVPEVCNGTSSECPADAYANSSIACGQHNLCDQPQYCIGTQPQCSLRRFQPANYSCMLPLDSCSNPGVCSGNSSVCSTPVLKCVLGSCNSISQQCMCNDTSLTYPNCTVNITNCETYRVPNNSLCLTCKSGYTPSADGKNCTDINECLINNGGCDPLVNCTNTPGNRTCGLCPPGYYGSGYSNCFDINECFTNNGGCDPLVNCTNTLGNRTCGPCPIGYYGSGYSNCIAPVCHNGILEPWEECDDNNTCCIDCKIANNNTICRGDPSNPMYECDEVEYCNGVNTLCPQDFIYGSTHSCGGLSNPCEAPRHCNGVSRQCPSPVFLPKNVTCLQPINVCSDPSVCSGSSYFCPELVDKCVAGVCSRTTRECVCADATLPYPNCTAPVYLCGNGRCEQNESCQNCPDDCFASCPAPCLNDCGGNGNCTNGLCVCAAGYSGPLCNLKTVNFTVDAGSNNSSSISVNVDSNNSTNNNTKPGTFRISLLSLVEFAPPTTSSPLQIVRNLSVDTLPFIGSYESAAQSGKAYDAWNYSTVTDDGVSLKIFVRWYMRQDYLVFAGDTYFMDANTLKYSVQIGDWSFSSPKNKLRLTITTNTTEVPTKKSCAGGNYQGTDNAGSVRWYVVPGGGASAMFGQLIEYALLDDKKTHITVKYDVDMRALTLDLPHFWNDALLDPNYSFLVDYPEPSDGGACQITDNSMESGFDFPTWGYIVVIIGFIALVAGMIVYARWRHRKRKHEEIELDS